MAANKDLFVEGDLAEMRCRFARVIDEQEQIEEGYREAEHRAVYDWVEDCDDWFGFYD